MDQIKIGKFIAECRRGRGLTQAQLAEKLDLTDRAVSKWECGRSMPDAALMLALCEILGITVNELLSGEKLNMEVNEYNQQVEQNLIALAKQKEESDKRLLNVEIVLGVLSGITLAVLLLVGILLPMDSWLRVVLIVGGFVMFLAAMFVCLGIEQKAGYYECPHCHEKYVPTFGQALWSPHMARTKYMRCPHCGQRSWHKKVLK